MNATIAEAACACVCVCVCVCVCLFFGCPFHLGFKSKQKMKSPTDTYLANLPSCPVPGSGQQHEMHRGGHFGQSRGRASGRPWLDRGGFHDKAKHTIPQPFLVHHAFWQVCLQILGIHCASRMRSMRCTRNVSHCWRGEMLH